MVSSTKMINLFFIRGSFMRMVIISLCILVALLGLWGWFYYASVEPTINYYWDNLSSLSDIVGREDWETAKKNMDIYFDKWDEVKKLWIFFINQRDIDNINSSMQQLYTYLRNQDKILAQAELEHLMVLFYIIDENECLSLENIF